MRARVIVMVMLTMEVIIIHAVQLGLRGYNT